MDPISAAAVQVVDSVLHQDIRAVVEDPHGAAHGAGLQQLLYWTSPSQCNDDALVSALTVGFAPTWTVPAATPSVADGAIQCATFLLTAPTPGNTSDVVGIVFGMCLATLLYQMSLCYLQGQAAVAGRQVRLPDDFDAMIVSLTDVMINDVDTFNGSLASYIAHMSSSIDSAINMMRPQEQVKAMFTLGVRQAVVSMMHPYIVLKYLCMFDPTKGNRADTNFFDARYSADAVYAVYSDALQQLTTMAPTTSSRGLTDADIVVLTRKYNLLVSHLPTVSTSDIVSMYDRVSTIATATRTVASRITGTDREIALRTGVTGAQVANVEYSKSRLKSERIQMWLWILACILATAVSAALIATGHTPQFWLLAVITFIVLAILAMIGFFRSPHPSNDTSF